MQPPSVTAAPQSAHHPALLQSLGLAGDRGDRRLFEGLDIALAGGSITWLRGRNGRGKTTLLRVLAGLSSPAEGQVLVDGCSLRELGTEGRRQWVYVGHANALKDELSVTESLQFLARLHGLPADAAALKLALQRLGMGHRQHAAVRTLSQGQRRRVALARLALSGSARLWLLDEPYDALDTEGIAALNSVLLDHARQGGAVLLTSHQALSIDQPAPQVLDLEAFAPLPAHRAAPPAGLYAAPPATPPATLSVLNTHAAGT